MCKLILAARLSLAFLWIFTALTSALFDRETGREVLSQAAITGDLAEWLINLGSGVDLFIGMWLLTGRRLEWICWIQLFVIIIYTVVLTFIAPACWLHPFGPVTKNIPLIVLIYGLLVTVQQRPPLIAEPHTDKTVRQ